ncbi:MAG: amidohydrolase [Clostridia bacterium]
MSEFVEYRREFHKYAEVSWTEIRTSARVAEILDSFGYKDILMGTQVLDTDVIIEPVRLIDEQKEIEKERAVNQGAKKIWVDKTEGYPGVIVEYDTGIQGNVSAFRFDIDSLAYDECDTDGYRPKEQGYRSINKDSVHACGHDAHTSIGLGIAKKIIQSQNIKSGKIRLIFQPAEESYSGAEAIVSKGHLDDVNYFMSLHLALTALGKPMPSNTLCCGCKDFLSDTQWDVFFEGKAAHPCGASQEGKNAILAACSATLNIHTIAPHEAGLFRVNVGEIRGGVAVNTIAPNAMISVEYRGEKQIIAEYARKRVKEILDGAALMHDVTYSVLDYGEIPAACSDDEIMEKVQDAAKKVDWFKNIHFEGNIGGTDDASVMMAKVQSHGGVATYVGIGTDANDLLHGPAFDFDEDCIDATIELFINVLEDLHK